MIEKLINTSIKPNCPIDLERRWKKWLNEITQVEDKVYLEKENKTTYGKIVDFYFDSIGNTKIFSKLFYNEQSILNNYPLIIYFHGSMSPTNKPWTIDSCLEWVKDGFSVVIFDARNQGGMTIDQNPYAFSEEYYLCQGIDQLESNYNKRLILDGVKLVQIIRNQQITLFKEFHYTQLVTCGASQGGEQALAIASITDDISLCIANIPSGCCLRERLINHQGKYNAIIELQNKVDNLNIEQIILDLGYFDLVNLVEQINCPVISSVGFDDQVCPPEYFYQAYRKIKQPKELYIYQGYGHGGYERIHHPKEVKFLIKYLKL